MALLIMRAYCTPVGSYERIINNDYIACDHVKIPCSDGQVCIEHLCDCIEDDIRRIFGKFKLDVGEKVSDIDYCICAKCIPLSPKITQ
jgi:hypothetical protein